MKDTKGTCQAFSEVTSLMGRGFSQASPADFMILKIYPRPSAFIRVQSV